MSDYLKAEISWCMLFQSVQSQSSGLPTFNVHFTSVKAAKYDFRATRLWNWRRDLTTRNICHHTRENLLRNACN